MLLSKHLVQNVTHCQCWISERVVAFTISNRPCWGGRACRSPDFQNKYSNNIAAQKLCYVAFGILLLFSTYFTSPCLQNRAKINKISWVQTKFIGVQMTGIRILPGVYLFLDATCKSFLSFAIIFIYLATKQRNFKSPTAIKQFFNIYCRCNGSVDKILHQFISSSWS
jgi:hypothetical protein